MANTSMLCTVGLALIVSVLIAPRTANAIDLSRLYGHVNAKRTGQCQYIYPILDM